VGDARTNSSFSATVQLFTDETNIAGACAYASSYPPVSSWIDETKLGFTGTPMYEITLLNTDGSTTVTVEAGSTFLLPCSYTISSFTDKTGAPGIINCMPPTGLMFASQFATICAGQTVTLTASATGAASYSINGTDWYASNVFEVAPTSTTAYTLYAQTEEGCIISATDAAVLTIHPTVSPGEITTDVKNATAGVNPPNVTITSVTDATGGSGNIAYQWRRSGTNPATLTGPNATYNLGNDVSNNYVTGGTYYFNRYAKDATCNTEWVASDGTYTLNLNPNPIPVTFCAECCWDGSASTWVNCYVTTNAVSASAQWSENGNTYYDGAASDKNGRANTEFISTYTSTSAIGLCKALGTGWYLPAYEELINMSGGSPYLPLNSRSGAGLLSYDYHWSSTECYNNGGRLSFNSNAASNAVVIFYDGSAGCLNKTFSYSVQCAWRP
jgi:hypothetical protein